VSGLWATKNEGVGLHTVRLLLTQKISKLPSFCGLCPRPHYTTHIPFAKIHKVLHFFLKLYFEFDCLDRFSPVFAPPTEKSLARLWITATKTATASHTNRLFCSRILRPVSPPTRSTPRWQLVASGHWSTVHVGSRTCMVSGRLRHECNRTDHRNRHYRRWLVGRLLVRWRLWNCGLRYRTHTHTQVNSAFHPSGVGKLSTGLWLGLRRVCSLVSLAISHMASDIP